MSTTPALLLAAGGVGLGHAVLPDHRVPLAMVARAPRWGNVLTAATLIVIGTLVLVGVL